MTDKIYYNGKILIDNNKIYYPVRNWQLAILCISFLIMGITIYNLYGSYNFSFFEKELAVDNYLDCKNGSLSFTVECLRNYVESIYNYTVRPDTIKDLEDIKKNGGDCFDYSNLYVRMAAELGFLGETSGLTPEEGSGHRIAILWDKNLTEYCVVDQTQTLGCITMEVNNED